MKPSVFFFLRIALAIWDLLWLHLSFRIVCSICVKNEVEILIVTVLNLEITLGSVDIFIRYFFQSLSLEYLSIYKKNFGGILVFLMYNIRSFAYRKNFAFFFSAWVPFIFLSFLLWLGLPVLLWIKVVRVDILVGQLW